ARAVEDAARAVPGITNSEGAEAGWHRTIFATAASNGFAASYKRSGHSISVSVIAGTGTGMESDYDYSSAIHGADLEAPDVVGRRAGERAVKRLNPRKVATQKVPVILDPRVSGGMLRHLAGAISGPSIARGTSFLKEKLGTRIFPESVTVIDD